MAKSAVDANGAPPEWVGIGSRIREARTEAHISVRELARRMNVSPSHVSQAERGLASFSVRALYNVASVLDISIDSLFDDPTAPGGAGSDSSAECHDAWGGGPARGLTRRAARR